MGRADRSNGEAVMEAPAIAASASSGFLAALPESSMAAAAVADTVGMLDRLGEERDDRA